MFIWPNGPKVFKIRPKTHYNQTWLPFCLFKNIFLNGHQIPYDQTLSSPSPWIILKNGHKTPYNLTFETLAPHITFQFFVIECDSLHPLTKHNTCNGNTTILFFWPSHTHNQTQNFYFELNLPIILNTILLDCVFGDKSFFNGGQDMGALSKVVCLYNLWGLVIGRHLLMVCLP